MHAGYRDSYCPTNPHNGDEQYEGMLKKLININPQTIFTDEFAKTLLEPAFAYYMQRCNAVSETSNLRLFLEEISNKIDSNTLSNSHYKYAIGINQGQPLNQNQINGLYQFICYATLLLAYCSNRAGDLSIAGEQLKKLLIARAIQAEAPKHCSEQWLQTSGNEAWLQLLYRITENTRAYHFYKPGKMKNIRHSLQHSKPPSKLDTLMSSLKQLEQLLFQNVIVPLLKNEHLKQTYGKQR